MEVKFIVTAKYANGDDYADKFDTLAEVANLLLYIEGEENNEQTDDNLILATQLSVTTEEV